MKRPLVESHHQTEPVATLQLGHQLVTVDCAHLIRGSRRLIGAMMPRLSSALAPTPMGNVPAFVSEAESTTAQGTFTILFTDLEGSTDLRVRVGDAFANEVIRLHDDLVRSSLEIAGAVEN